MDAIAVSSSAVEPDGLAPLASSAAGAAALAGRRSARARVGREALELAPLAAAGKRPLSSGRQAAALSAAAASGTAATAARRARPVAACVRHRLDVLAGSGVVVRERGLRRPRRAGGGRHGQRDERACIPRMPTVTTAVRQSHSSPPSRFRVFQAQHAIPFVVAVAYISTALAGGGFSVQFRAGAALLVWWVVLIGIAFGILPRARVPGRALAAGGGLLALVALTGLSVAWSSDNGATFTELVRASGYLGLFALVVLASPPGSARLWLSGLAVGLDDVAAARPRQPDRALAVPRAGPGHVPPVGRDAAQLSAELLERARSVHGGGDRPARVARRARAVARRAAPRPWPLCRSRRSPSS